jgi:hypothetical protein
MSPVFGLGGIASRDHGLEEAALAVSELLDRWDLPALLGLSVQPEPPAQAVDGSGHP